MPKVLQQTLLFPSKVDVGWKFRLELTILSIRDLAAIDFKLVDLSFDILELLCLCFKPFDDFLRLVADESIRLEDLNCLFYHLVIESVVRCLSLIITQTSLKLHNLCMDLSHVDMVIF